MKRIRSILLMLLAVSMLVTFVGCNDEEESNSKKKNETNNSIEQTNQIDEKNGDNPIATMVVEYIDEKGNKEEGTVKLELYPDKAPITVANFINLANENFYDGLTFHRIVD